MAQAKCAFAFVVEVKKGRRCREHGHPCTEIVLCHRGAGTLVQAGHRYPYRDGSLLVYEPGQTHWIEPRTGGWHICVGVIGCEVTTIPPGVHASNGRLRQLFGDVRDALEHTSARQQLRLDLLAGLIAVELSELTCRATAPTHAQRAREIIEHSFHEPLSVRALAEKIYISPDYLRQVFRREFGESLMHYLIRRRLEFAADLLRSTPDPVKAIAGQAGYGNPYHFSRLFRKRFGQSPSAYRSQSRTAPAAT